MGEVDLTEETVFVSKVFSFLIIRLMDESEPILRLGFCNQRIKEAVGGSGFGVRAGLAVTLTREFVTSRDSWFSDSTGQEQFFWAKRTDRPCSEPVS